MANGREIVPFFAFVNKLTSERVLFSLIFLYFFGFSLAYSYLCLPKKCNRINYE